MKFHTRLLGALTLAALAAGTAVAEAPFPSKPITIVAAFPPGGGADVIARLIAPKLSQRLGQTVIVDNRAGASGNIATEYVARAKPDGYTLLMNNNTLTINTALGMRQSFNTQKDLKFIAAMASTPIAIAVHPSLPVKTVDELVAYARQQGGKLTFSSCGNGTAQHFTGARFSQVAKVDMIHVPYKGCSPAIIDGIGGQVPVLFNTVPNLDPQVQAGKLRYIAVAAQQRLPFKPDLPTVAESKGFPGFDAEVWFGLIGPAAMPPEVAKRLEAEVLAVMQDKELQKAFADRLVSTRILDSAQFEKQIAQDLATWKRLSEELKVKLD
ncbi:tripartite tricarboxylate transporter substrate binding protein [Variovorax sp. J31P207]|uniref:tripartite tricarboxylate transporter substrate binding protein n=1 Tax=Variovorax sp. J31P207 TaxID=3053510 RepID=UPI00257600BD|nr:tripartite tricarboxylate transporter substrate binding protein [Variovorax sp. J31P207]MDM0066968.1 tripartite tricarboxylate transporter substrate binding protein [Variovorax sp. J31P207]